MRLPSAIHQVATRPCFAVVLVLLAFAALRPTRLEAQTDVVLVDLAREMFEFGEYEDARALFQQAIAENPNNAEAHLMVGRCFLRTTSGKKESVGYLKKALKLDPTVSPHINYLLAEGYRFSYDFENATAQYKEYLSKLKSGPKSFPGEDIAALVRRTEKRIQETQTAKNLVANPVPVKITNLGTSINSENEDYAPVIARDGSVLFFTSRRPGSTGEMKDHDNLPFEDIYMSKRSGGKWASAENVGDKINSETHESNIALSPDGRALYVYKTENAGDIYVATYKKEKWGKLEEVGLGINTKSKETSIFFSPEGDQIFFSSDRPGGKGGLDIYVIGQDRKGGWMEPTLLPGRINTEYDEEGPVFDPKTKTMYFSSKGHNSMGGYDLFKSVWNEVKQEWSEPENLGFPINSPDDDVYFSLSEDGFGYYSSSKEDSYGGTDIYLIEFLPKEKVQPKEPQVNITKQPVRLEVSVIDAQSSEPVSASVSLVEKESGKVIESQEVGPEGFVFLVPLDMTGAYQVEIKSIGYDGRRISITIPEATAEQQILRKRVVMNTGAERSVFILHNIYFDFDQTTLKPESFKELETLHDLMTRNPAMTIELAGHTDFIGSDGYNKGLSERRAKAVAQYLLGKGISAERIKWVGYGETKPMASNDDEEEGRELNRRTEFVILSR